VIAALGPERAADLEISDAAGNPMPCRPALKSTGRPAEAAGVGDPFLKQNMAAHLGNLPRAERPQAIPPRIDMHLA